MSGKKTILLIDDEPDLLESCVRILEDEGFACVATTESHQALSLAKLHNPFMVITDFMMPGKNGMEVLADIKTEFPRMPVVMISAYATINGVVEAVKMGAFDYVTKPFSSDQLIIAVRRALEQHRLQTENEALNKKLKGDFFNHFFVGKHPKFLEAVELICKVAKSESNILICGETGTGKELAARAVHVHSKRAGEPFITIDSATLTKEMIEAVPIKDIGADGSPKSIFEVADGGTLYLERVEELDPAVQSILIRVLQDSKIPRKDEWESVAVDVRIIASTTIDLFAEMMKSKFQENLYYSLNVVNITMPPLRERKEDIGILCDHFFREMAEKNGTDASILHKDTLAKLMEYDWPGNVRQLRNVMETVALSSESRELEISDIPEEIRYSSGSSHFAYKEARQKWLERFEKHYLQNLLFSHKGNISRASEVAGVARMSLYRMLKRTGLNKLVIHERTADKNRIKGKSKED